MRAQRNQITKHRLLRISAPNKLLPLFLALLFFASFMKVEPALAAPIWRTENTEKVATPDGHTEETSSAELSYVQDLAHLLTDEEEESLQARCEEVGNNHDIDLFILTVDSVPDNRKTYIEDFFDSYADVLQDATILLVNMDPDNRGVEIQGYGQCEFSISDSRIELILDAIVPYLSDGDYSSAFEAYINEVAYYMATDPDDSAYVHTEEDNQNYNEDYYEDRQQEQKASFWKRTLWNLLISALIGGGSVAVMAAHSKGQVTVNKDTYMDSKNSHLLGHWDRYLRTTTTRVHKPRNDGGSHGGGHSGGGGVSSGGHSHSGGGRSF